MTIESLAILQSTRLSILEGYQFCSEQKGFQAPLPVSDLTSQLKQVVTAHYFFLIGLERNFLFDLVMAQLIAFMVALLWKNFAIEGLLLKIKENSLD